MIQIVFSTKSKGEWITTKRFSLENPRKIDLEQLRKLADGDNVTFFGGLESLKELAKKNPEIKVVSGETPRAFLEDHVEPLPF